MRTQTGLDIRLSLADEPDAPATIKEALILISREALHNVVKHAGADRVEIGLDVDAGQMLLLIADDGRGFDPTLSRPGHFGMQSMRERAAVFGGTLELVSTQGVGTQICVRVPLEVKRSVVIPQGKWTLMEELERLIRAYRLRASVIGRVQAGRTDGFRTDTRSRSRAVLAHGNRAIGMSGGSAHSRAEGVAKRTWTRRSR